MLISSVLNMVLDPIFIYTFGLGVVGAAVATMLSIAVSATVILYWLTVKKDTYVNLRLRYFRRDWRILREIFAVGVPSSLAQISMSITMIVLNTIVIMAGGDYGMAVFSGGWRVVMLAIVPLMGIAAAVTTVTGAAYGARNHENLRVSYLYGVKIGTVIGSITGALIWIFAPNLTFLFTYTEESAHLAPGIIEFLRYIVLYFPAVAAGMLTSSMFRGIGKGLHSLDIMIIRTLILQVSFAYLFGILLGWGLSGVWIGIVIANIIASAIALAWGIVTVRRIARRWESQGADKH
jgi:putative MATE family efflux protein